MNSIARRVITAYGWVHPSMYGRARWRISKENAEALARALGVNRAGVVDETFTNIFGMPVDFVDSDEILLVLVVT